MPKQNSPIDKAKQPASKVPDQADYDDSSEHLPEGKRALGIQDEVAKAITAGNHLRGYRQDQSYRQANPHASHNGRHSSRQNYPQ
jgi:hypothetical protein